jgi:Flp pilus assembly protein TadG
MRRFIARRLVGRLRESRGANMVEAALITPLLLLLTFSVVDFSSIFYVYLALENGVAQASRYGVTGAAAPLMTREESIRAAMRTATPTITLPDAAFTFTHLRPGQSTWLTGVGGPGDVVKVRVDYTWTLFTPLVSQFFTNGQINLQVESAMLSERSFN